MTRKSKGVAPADRPRPNQVKVSLTDETTARLDEWRSKERRKRADAAAFLIERGLDAEGAR